MLIALKTQLKVNKTQRQLLARHAGAARFAWNWGLGLTRQILDHNRLNPEDKIKFPGKYDLDKWFVALVKPDNLWLYEISSICVGSALSHLRDAWGRCFNKISKPPRFKKKGRNDSFTLRQSIYVEHFRIKVPKIGWLKTYERLPQGANPKSVTISRKADRWFISFNIEVEPKITPKTSKIVGVDLGISALATLSTGQKFDNPRPYQKHQKKLSRMQWLNRRKKIGSIQWKRAQLKIARLHLKIGNIRKDTLHKATSYLSKNHAAVVIEDLNVKGMLANRKLSKAIADSGFYEFRRQLQYKCELYGSQLVVVDRFFPSSKTCSHCGEIKEDLTLKDRWFTCPDCGFFFDRDWNAAINLMKAGGSLVSAPGVVSADTTTLKG
ncbi:RNA-guided endonuclease InsQ/TnpB family protein [Gloeothece verrucosa]|uniref:Transposase, IS605 OrfB family n=1 Tax=Gloeothece verrucosa (strain PCC 7822) TaxID=497965 RepID=E0ULY7_GLOV7|nr:RNA-guided endonuclease TnpB family protein [Gloeothece verrucosa]ADN17967.1 transposase, IS605 OrfB family [Gloeothece verrucosa PCC 7822]